MINLHWPAAIEIKAHYNQSINSLEILTQQATCLTAKQLADLPLDKGSFEVIASIRSTPLAEWLDCLNLFRNRAETQAVMQLFAAFEGLLSRDAKARAGDADFEFHDLFAKAALPKQGTRRKANPFSSMSSCLEPWDAAANTIRIADFHLALKVLRKLFVDDRNSIMHTDRGNHSGLAVILEKLESSLLALRRHVPTLGVSEGISDLEI